MTTTEIGIDPFTTDAIDDTYFDLQTINGLRCRRDPYDCTVTAGRTRSRSMYARTTVQIIVRVPQTLISTEDAGSRLNEGQSFVLFGTNQPMHCSSQPAITP